ncbi:MAG TPA: hypothetical protein VKB41_12305 [Steroidobacteraceae bacterium]|nr:hypothetical protein [Steroidobacteraceae bacterium]
MKTTGSRWGIALLIVSGGVLAAEPPAPADSASAATPAATQTEAAAPAPAAAAAESAATKIETKTDAAKPAAPAAAAAPAAKEGSPLAEDAEFQRAAKSYTKVEQKGRTMYCKKEYPMGSRLPVTQCLTEGELADQVRSTGQIKEQMQTRPKGIPNPAG